MSDVIIAQAAVLHRAASPLSVERVLPPRRGEVRVRLKTAGVCHSDLHVIEGDLATPVPMDVSSAFPGSMFSDPSRSPAGLAITPGDGRPIPRQRLIRSRRPSATRRDRLMPAVLAY
jgi:hypothetical protein